MSQNVSAADLSAPPAVVRKAPPAIAKDTWSWWIEGGAFTTGGIGSGGAPFGVQGLGIKPNWGGEGAIGFDWQGTAFAPWHLSAQFRYGTAQKSRKLNTAFSGTTTTNGIGFTGTATANETLREDHWLVDFNVGRDFGLGNGSNAQWTLGVRVADLRSELNINGNFALHATARGGTTTAGAANAQQKSTFWVPVRD